MAFHYSKTNNQDFFSQFKENNIQMRFELLKHHKGNTPIIIQQTRIFLSKYKLT